MTHSNLDGADGARHRRERWSARSVWGAGLTVALGAAVATAHGLYAVVLATGTLPFIAGLYPLITDGLALVAYAATARLTGPGRRYAWSIVVLAAGLSGLAQAVHMAGGLDSATGTQPGAGIVPTELRFGIGAWPAIAAAIVAHLLYLLGRNKVSFTSDVLDEQEQSNQALVVEQVQAEPDPMSVQPAMSSNLGLLSTVTTSASNAGSHPLPAASSSGVHGGQAGVHPQSSTQSSEAEQVHGQTSIPVARPASKPGGRPPAGSGGGGAAAGAPRDRARASALRHREQAGGLPTVSVLMRLADVSRGTAGNALAEIRTSQEGQPTAAAGTRPLHVVNASNVIHDRSNSQ